ncbi:MAG: AmiR/NasT family two-component response regulator [Arenicella sp.]|jgi:AmiR/NasT family two-component response regulator
MNDVVPLKDTNVLRKLRSMRLLLIHPDEPERQIFIDHLNRIGCKAESAWPAPDNLPENIDVVLFVLNKTNDKGALTWVVNSEIITRIAIISFETPEILTELERLNVHGVLSKPIRLFGVLAAINTAISLSRYENRLKQRVRSLDETLKARRKIEQAVSILAVTKKITEAQAYKLLREKSQNSKTPIVELVEAIITASDI